MTEQLTDLIEIAELAKRLANLTHDFVDANAESELTEVLRDGHADAYRLWASLRDFIELEGFANRAVATAKARLYAGAVVK